jgi:hypothetical protein
MTRLPRFWLIGETGGSNYDLPRASPCADKASEDSNYLSVAASSITFYSPEGLCLEAQCYTGAALSSVRVCHCLEAGQ